MKDIRVILTEYTGNQVVQTVLVQDKDYTIRFEGAQPVLTLIRPLQGSQINVSADFNLNESNKDSGRGLRIDTQAKI